MLTRLKNAGIRLRRDKCSFCASVTYLGFIVSSAGRAADPEKVRAMLNFPPPSDVSSLRSFLGLVRFYDKFIPDLSTVVSPLHNLLKKSNAWRWDGEEQDAFEKVKTILSSTLTLVHYDPCLPIVLSCDASPVGAVLSH